MSETIQELQAEKLASSHPVLPNGHQQDTNPVTFYTYHAQLTFGCKALVDVNVAEYFRCWVYSSSQSLLSSSVIQYNDDKGMKVTSVDQLLSDNPEFYKTYYHNHRTLNHGNLTGMVLFQCSMPWNMIKKDSEYFKWLRLNRVFLNQTKFKMDTIVPCGFLLGAHPGFFRRDKAEKEFQTTLNFTDPIPFQLFSRSVSVPISSQKQDRFSFQAVVVETSVAHAAALWEWFYSLNPDLIRFKHPYTAPYPFVPFLPSRAWTVEKIYKLAMLHLEIITDQRPIFLQNLQDLCNIVFSNSFSLLQGFLSMCCSSSPDSTELAKQLIVSMHNTGNPTTKVVLIPKANEEEALKQLAAIHSIMLSNIDAEFHSKVFLEGKQAGLTSQQVDSIQSSHSTSYAMRLLDALNPQDGEEVEIEIPPKHLDLKSWIAHLQTQGHDIILGMDANDPYDPDHPVSPYPLEYTPGVPTLEKHHNGKLSTLVATCNLIDPLARQHPTRPFPASHVRGKSRIDYIFISAALWPAVLRTGSLPHFSILHGDHLAYHAPRWG